MPPQSCGCIPSDYLPFLVASASGAPCSSDGFSVALPGSWGLVRHAVHLSKGPEGVRGTVDTGSRAAAALTSQMWRPRRRTIRRHPVVGTQAGEDLQRRPASS